MSNDLDNQWWLQCSIGQAAAFIDWLAQQPCTTPSGGRACLETVPVGHMEWRCPSCRAFELRYGK